MLRKPDSPRLAATERWQERLRGFPSIGLEDIRNTASSDRIDTKFVLRASDVAGVVEALRDDYAVLDIDGWRFTSYRTQYFDTGDLELFRRHHTGAGQRYKIRTRTYLNTGLAFVEIKAKTPRGRTTKVRMRTQSFETELGSESLAFIESQGVRVPGKLVPMLRNSFDRICLVDSIHAERLTIDLDLEVETETGVVGLPDVAIAEFKHERNGRSMRDADFLRQMRALHLRPTGFSKYCIGLLLTRPEIKHNLFKPQLRKLRGLMGEANVGL